MVTISTFNGASQQDKTQPQGFRGNFFHHKWKTSWDQNHHQNKKSVALRFTYHVSENLKTNINIIRKEMDEKLGPGAFDEHYNGIPRPMVGKRLFGADFDPTHHIRDDVATLQQLNPDEPLFLCFDPGYTMQAGVLGQLDPDKPRLTYLRAWTATNKTFGTFIDEVLLKLRRIQALAGWDILFFVDLQAKQANDQTGETNANILFQKTNQYPVMKKRRIEPGVEVMRSYMRLKDGFVCSNHPDNKILADALQNAVATERKGLFLGTYTQDGYYEHPLDAARYPADFLSNGMAADQTPPQLKESSYTVAVSPYTGYY